MILLLAHSLLPPLPTVSSTGDTLRKKDNLLTGERGRGWGRSQIIRPQKALRKNLSWKQR
jgi:hypothetical protein